MNNHRISPFLLALGCASMVAACSGDERRTTGGGSGSKIRDSGVIADAGAGGGDGGAMTGCESNPNNCAANELVGAAPSCTCLNVCEVGFVWNTTTLMCDPVSNAVCGDGVVEGNEECDDGNTTSGDGCSSTCRTETPMGATCQEACDYLFSCTEMQCPGTVDVTACVQQCTPDPAGFQVDLIVGLTCQEINDQICITMQETNSGDPCTMDSDCMAGTLQPFCIQATDMNGDPSGWEGGYCAAIGCRADEECGTNKLCVTIDQQGNTACFQGCDPATNGMGVCRMGYACPDLSQGMGIGACIPACTSDMDCGQGSTCNLMTGQCE